MCHFAPEEQNITNLTKLKQYWLHRSQTFFIIQNNIAPRLKNVLWKVIDLLL